MLASPVTLASKGPLEPLIPVYVMPPPKVTPTYLLEDTWAGHKFEGSGFIMSMFGDLMCCGMQQLGYFGVLPLALKDRQINWEGWILEVNKFKLPGQCAVSSIILEPDACQWAAKSFLEAWGAVKVTEFINPNTKRLLGIYHKVA